MSVILKFLQARLLIVTTLVLLSACVINKANDTPKAESGDEDSAGVTDDATDATTVMQPATAPAPKADAAPAVKNDASVQTAAKAPLQRAAKPAAHAPAKALAQKPVAGKAAKDAKVVRYVSADVLNVRSSPRGNAPVVGKLTRGSMFTVALQGDWAMLGDGQYVQVKFLSRTRSTAHGRLAARK